MFQLTSTVERIPYQPTLLGDMNIFNPNPIRTKALGVEERDGVLVLIQTSQRGAPVNSERTTEKRKMRYFEVPRITQGDTIHADEIQGIRAFGEETELMQVQAEVARRLAGPTGLIANIGYTWENMRLGAVQGLLLDADGSTLYNWFDEFGFAAPAEVAFNLAAGNAANSLRPIINGIVRGDGPRGQGRHPADGRVVGALRRRFYDLFTNHPDVIRTFLNWSDARRHPRRPGRGLLDLRVRRVDWINYRGSDDNSTIKIADDKVKFFPNAPRRLRAGAWRPATRASSSSTPPARRCTSCRSSTATATCGGGRRSIPTRCSSASARKCSTPAARAPKASP
jgi:hypothetical protein